MARVGMARVGMARVGDGEGGDGEGGDGEGGDGEGGDGEVGRTEEAPWLCRDCRTGRHRCFICGKRGIDFKVHLLLCCFAAFGLHHRHHHLPPALPTTCRCPIIFFTLPCSIIAPYPPTYRILLMVKELDSYFPSSFFLSLIWSADMYLIYCRMYPIHCSMHCLVRCFAM